MSQQLITNHRKRLKTLQGKLHPAIRFNKESEIDAIWEEAEAIVTGMMRDGSADWVYEKGITIFEYFKRSDLYNSVEDMYWKDISPRCIDWLTDQMMQTPEASV